MKHGQNCDCMMCTLGKKVGMIPNKKDDANNATEMKCEHCGQQHAAGSSCNQK